MANRRIILSRSARKSLDNLEKSNPVAAQIVIDEIETLANEDSLINLHSVRVMRYKQQGYMRAEAGNLRIIFKEKNGVLDIAAVDKRNDNKAYREFKRKNS